MATLVQIPKSAVTIRMTNHFRNMIIKPPRRIRRKHIFDHRSKDAQLSKEDDLRRTMFSSIDGITAEIREGFQQNPSCRI
ncbi:hypothetical protein TNCV_4126951 [Trichonephila clavipes]|uniref:Uncharacterized protein n=1 Tax=Trichonephila clavipes TaxID=2585209 RepID=A0A8X6T5T9_TRICX|nr:hypothetical protein TNCV_4126951 [Trichonephila clavipes]